MYADHTVGVPSGHAHAAISVPRSFQVAERAEATQAALVASARRLFVEKSYFETGTEEIVRDADGSIPFDQQTVPAMASTVTWLKAASLSIVDRMPGSAPVKCAPPLGEARSSLRQPNADDRPVVNADDCFVLCVDAWKWVIASQG